MLSIDNQYTIAERFILFMSIFFGLKKEGILFLRLGQAG